VIYHPRTKDKLHRMRIAGKPLRYIMEIGEGAFGQEFKSCLDEYKNTIELLGDIHDGDVIIPELSQHLKEVRNFNKTLSTRKEHLTTKGIRDMISHFRKKRNEDFIKFREQIEKWENEDFRSRLLRSMEP
jgi:CHAD domain-containing protein